MQTCLHSHLKEIDDGMLDYKKRIQFLNTKLDDIQSLINSNAEKIKVLSNEIALFSGHVNELKQRSSNFVMDLPVMILAQINGTFQKQEIAIKNILFIIKLYL